MKYNLIFQEENIEAYCQQEKQPLQIPCSTQERQRTRRKRWWFFVVGCLFFFFLIDCSSNVPSSSKTSPTLLATTSTQSLSKASKDRSHIYRTGSLVTPTGSSSAAAFADELLNDDLVKVLFLKFFSFLLFYYWF